MNKRLGFVFLRVHYSIYTNFSAIVLLCVELLEKDRCKFKKDPHYNRYRSPIKKKKTLQLHSQPTHLYKNQQCTNIVKFLLSWCR